MEAGRLTEQQEETVEISEHQGGDPEMYETEIAEDSPD